MTLEHIAGGLPGNLPGMRQYADIGRPPGTWHAPSIA